MTAHDTDELSSERSMTRAKLLGGGLAAGGALALTGGLLAPAASARAGASAATTGGRLVFAVETAPFGFDPPKWWSLLEFTGVYAIFDRLLAVSHDGKHILPELAALPTVGSGGKSYTFHLRHGVKFHHGREMTADDVKYSLERIVDPKLESQGVSLYNTLPIVGYADLAAGKAKEAKGIKVVDPHTLRIQLEQPESALLDVLALPFASIVPRDVVEHVGAKQFNKAPVGSGPFVAKKVELASEVLLERNPAYWKPGVPHIDQVDWQVGVGSDLAVLRIEKGQADMMFEPVPKGAYHQIAGDPSLKKQLVVDVSNNVFYITLNIKHPALAKLAVRQAIASAVDKRRLVKTINGLGIPATGGLFSPLSPYYQPTIGYTHDPARARQLLAQAGYPNGFKVPYWAVNQTPYIEEGQTVQQDLKAVGIDVEFKSYDINAYNGIVVKNLPQIMQNTWELPYPHGSYVMDGGFTQAALKGGCCNFSSWVSPAFEKLAARAHRATSSDRIVALYKEMDRTVVHDEALWVPMFYPKVAMLVSKRVRGYSIPATPSGTVKFFADYALAA
jgi:oligopeptide transport system substrate-binding protein